VGITLPQRKCGTCKYFEEGGIAASGWCRHPERQDLQFMVLVRKTELACRNGWNEDLWEPAPGQGDDELSAGISGAIQSKANGAQHNPGHEKADYDPDSSRTPRGEEKNPSDFDHRAVTSRSAGSSVAQNNLPGRAVSGTSDSRPPSNRSQYQSEEAIDESPVSGTDRPEWLMEMRKRQLEQRREVSPPAPPVLNKTHDDEDAEVQAVSISDTDQTASAGSNESGVPLESHGPSAAQFESDLEGGAGSFQSSREVQQDYRQSGYTEPFDFHSDSESPVDE
jgi:hypothetical protein